MYRIAHQTLRLDGVITEFADIYAPLSQIWKTDGYASKFSVLGSKNLKSFKNSNLQV